MNKFMSNLWNAGEFQAVLDGGLVGKEEAPLVGADGSRGGGDGGGSGICPQGSFSLPPWLCRKTVEEVWAENNMEPQPVHAQP
ncbi:unnamed protein product [Triticum turgidum subsp. durum]|uniref:Uncharacterized protein n=1 Tax=Triticum turgidum subsp. durum TaxID=4567 RepID=A0A9R1S6K1_TRITD|nr:unnamed protein product [Triticum turgidum subsp. durum]